MTLRRFTQAYNGFKESLGIAAELLKIEERYYHDPPHPDELSAVQGLRGGAAVLMVAAFEAYLRSVPAEVLDVLIGPKSRVTFSKLPEEMQVYSIYQTLELAMSGPKYQKSGPKKDRLKDIIIASRVVLSEKVNPAVFGDTGSNPDATTVKEICKSMGLRDIFPSSKAIFDVRWRAPTHPEFVEQKLAEIIDRRHKVAHAALYLGISRTDLTEAIRFLRNLGAVIDIQMRQHIVAVKRAAR